VTSCRDGSGVPKRTHPINSPLFWDNAVRSDKKLQIFRRKLLPASFFCIPLRISRQWVPSTQW